MATKRARDLEVGERIGHPADRVAKVESVRIVSDLGFGGEAVDLQARMDDGSLWSTRCGSTERIRLAPAEEPEPVPKPKQRRRAPGGTASATEKRTTPKASTLPDDPPWKPIGSTEVAAMLGVEDQTVRAWRTRGRIIEPTWMIGGRPVWRSDVLEEWARETGRL